MSSLNASEWTTSEVVQKLQSLGLGQYGNSFLGNDITGEVLPNLTDSHLKELGIKLIGHRLTILDFIKNISEGQPSTVAAKKTTTSNQYNVEPTKSTSSYAPPQLPQTRRKVEPVKSTMYQDEDEDISVKSNASNWEQKRKNLVKGSKREADSTNGQMRKVNSAEQFGRKNYDVDDDEDESSKIVPQSRTRPNSRTQKQNYDDYSNQKTNQKSSYLNNYQNGDDDDDVYPPPYGRQQAKPTQRRQPAQPINTYDDDDDDEEMYQPPPKNNTRTTRQSNAYDPYESSKKPPALNKKTPTSSRRTPPQRLQSDSDHSDDSRHSSSRRPPSRDQYEDEYAPPARNQNASRRPPVHDYNQEPELNNLNPFPQGDVERVACRYCGRKFASDRIDKHEGSCLQKTKKKRVFDSRKQRIGGTDAAKYINKMDEPEPQPPKKSLKYKIEHEKLIANLRRARGAEVGGPGGGMDEFEEEADDRVSCPFCGRKFASEAAAKHIPVCERMSKNKKGALPPNLSKRGRR